MKENNEVYNIIYSLKGKGNGIRLIKRGTKRARMVTNGFTSHADSYLRYLLCSRDCTIYIHNKNGQVARIIKSESGISKNDILESN